MRKYLILPALFVALSFASCTKDQIDPIGAQDTPEKAEARSAISSTSNALLTGTWCVTSCINSTGELAPQYKEYCFSFATNNSLFVKDAVSASMAGNWTVGYIDSKTRLSLSFISNSGFDALSGSWTIMEGSTSKKILLQAVADRGCSLTLEKQ